MKLAVLVLLLVCSACYAYAQRAKPRRMQGKAAYYGEGYRGKIMANGERFDPDRFTCATFAYPLGTMLQVRSCRTGRSVIVEVTDRGPAFWTHRLVDLSARAFSRIAPPAWGICEVSIQPLTDDSR